MNIFNSGTRTIALLLISMLLVSAGCGSNRDLVEAARKGNIKKAKRLLWFGVDVDARHIGDTPLMNAVRFCQKQMVEFLIDNGADVNAVDGNGRTVLMKGVSLWHCGYKAERISVKHGLMRVIANMANVNLPMDYDIDMGADSQSRRREIVELLIEKGSDVNAVDKGRISAAAICADDPEPGLLEILLANGADPNVSTERGWTPLMIASASGRLENAKLLIAGGAGLSGKNERGESALELAVKHGHPEIVKLLLNAGAAIDFDVEYFIKHPPEGFMRNLAFSEIFGLLKAAGADIIIDDIPRPIPLEERTFKTPGDIHKPPRSNYDAE